MQVHSARSLHRGAELHHVTAYISEERLCPTEFAPAWSDREVRTGKRQLGSTGSPEKQKSQPMQNSLQYSLAYTINKIQPFCITGMKTNTPRKPAKRTPVQLATNSAYCQHITLIRCFELASQWLQNTIQDHVTKPPLAVFQSCPSDGRSTVMTSHINISPAEKQRQQQEEKHLSKWYWVLEELNQECRTCQYVKREQPGEVCSRPQPPSQPLLHVEGETEKGERSSDQAWGSLMLPTSVCVVRVPVCAVRVPVYAISLLLLNTRNFCFNFLCKMLRYQSKIWLGKEVDVNFSRWPKSKYIV